MAATSSNAQHVAGKVAKAMLYLVLIFIHTVLGDLSPTPSPDAPAAENAVPLPADLSFLTDQSVHSTSTHFHTSRRANVSVPKRSSYILQQQMLQSNTCNFDNLIHGSSFCSRLTWQSVTEKAPYEEARKECYDFNTSYEETCKTCTNAVLSLRDDLLDGAKENDTEKAVCGVASVIVVAATYIGDPSWVDSFYRCLPALDKMDQGYVKVRYSTMKVLFALFIATVGLILVISLIKYVTKREKPLQRPPPPPPPLQDCTSWSGLYRFSKTEIENAINFCDKKSLGRGSAGEVFKGVLPSGQEVAIKHINKSNTSDTFRSEVKGLSRVRHPNLVSLFGYCIDGGEQYLVYEYCASGNLANQLLKEDTPLTWEKRVKILRDCARALAYLHHYIYGCIVHRDIKLTNILLTNKLEPKLSDFGLAKVLGMEESKVFTDIRGTIGYMDPEYMSNAKLTCASDIYSFGIVTLQVLSGQKVIELDLDARDQLTRKAKDVMMGKRPLSDFEDSRLEEDFDREDFKTILQVAVFCVAKSSKDRPTIDDVFDEMDMVWKNTVANTKLKDTNPSATSLSRSRSWDVIPV
ncbi:hypothetical protein MLD38_016395 [Melastoma candidum]|uniref:Uncharacterized protein n=1 Tax=Melastoma candidum TaxID=119954 RepID=A0ACB9RJF0_9MYRT|nr:hypothetical protein MLD38_016395 [Melastoma candidum]